MLAHGTQSSRRGELLPRASHRTVRAVHAYGSLDRSIRTPAPTGLIPADAGAGTSRFLCLDLCGRMLRHPDASGGSVVPPPEGLSANTRPNCRGPVFLNPSLPLLHRLSPVSSLLWRDPTSPWASSGCRCLLPVYRSRGPTWISLSKNTECPATPAPITAPASVGFRASRLETR